MLQSVVVLSLLNAQLLDVGRRRLPELQRSIRERVLIQRIVNFFLDDEDGGRRFEFGEVFLLALPFLADQQLLRRLLSVGEAELGRHDRLGQSIALVEVFRLGGEREVFGRF